MCEPVITGPDRLWKMYLYQLPWDSSKNYANRSRSEWDITNTEFHRLKPSGGRRWNSVLVISHSILDRFAWFFGQFQGNYKENVWLCSTGLWPVLTGSAGPVFFGFAIHILTGLGLMVQFFPVLSGPVSGPFSVLGTGPWSTTFHSISLSIPS